MIRFGPSGNGNLFYDQGYNSSLEAPLWLKNRGLNAYEYSFSRGVRISDFTAKSLGDACKQNGIEISVHTPYYINLANDDDKKVEKSFEYIISSLKYLKLMGGHRCVFHPGSCMGRDRAEAFQILKKNMAKLVEKIDKENLDFDFLLCPETMGKSMQLGTYEEVAELCTLREYLVPTLDFGHINALTHGSLKGEDDYKKIFDHLINTIGLERTKKVHIHFSKIEYGEKGEIKHLTFEDTHYGPDFVPLAKVIKEYNLEPDIICESDGTQAEDATEMKNIYESL